MTSDSNKQKEKQESDDRKEDIITELSADNITGHYRQDQLFAFTSQNGIKLFVEVYTEHIFRIRYLAEGDLQTDFSYATDPNFKGADINIRQKETAEYFKITTSAVTCLVTKEQMNVHFYDAEDRALCKDHHGFYRRESLMKGITKIEVTKEAPRDVTYWGLGDKVPENNLRGHSFENWNTDSFEYERGDDPLYRSIPFYAALHRGQAYGIFLDSPYRTYFDFDSDENNISSFSADGGVMDYYFINGPTLTKVSERYTRLTGTPEMPPMWALGYHQCRWSYYPKSQVQKLAQTFRKKNIPCDALYLDIDYMDGYRCFTWNKDYFPDPETMIANLKKEGFKTVVMIDPGIKADDDYFVFQEGQERDYFCRRTDGELALAPVWPDQSAFPDFTHPKVRSWWANLYERLLTEQQVDGVWNDMNEPAVFEVKSRTLPKSVRHHYEGQPCSHKKAHNIYGLQMAQASFEGLKKHRPNKRPFLLTRANFAGGQRYSALWTGDNVASWDHLKLANEQCQRLSISGYSFVGTDIGGFVDDPTPELFTRWLQLSVFHPLFRTHTMGFNVDGAAAVDEDSVKQQKKRKETSDQEPWSYGKKYTDINRATIELRYRLLDYLYTAFYQYTQQGTPILRPLGYYDPSDDTAVQQTDPFLFGSQILVSLALEKGQTKVKTYLPNGNWYDFHTNRKYTGQQYATADAPIEKIPFFIRAGTILPLREVMQYTSEHPKNVLELNTYFIEGTASSLLYEDAEEGYGYTKGNYRLTTFRLSGDAENKTLALLAERDGPYQPEYQEVTISFIGLPFAPNEAIVDGMKVSVKKIVGGPQFAYQISTHPNFKTIRIS